jgi:hypothetical protein
MTATGATFCWAGRKVSKARPGNMVGSDVTVTADDRVSVHGGEEYEGSGGCGGGEVHRVLWGDYCGEVGKTHMRRKLRLLEMEGSIKF